MSRHKGPRDGSGTRTAIGLDNVAIDVQRALAQSVKIDCRAQGTSNQALNLLGAAGLFAARSLPVHACAGGTGQHAVFGGQPALILALEKAGYFFYYAGGADDLRIAATDQHRTFRMFGVMPNNLDIT
ncbi:hypothetical protein GALL_496560 [mine drainage metagenome]|uniref:Uncharacterized protein n=1 Tax=mine drainage metagenome TaxID=410659 RepID=A0A1J5PC06_9ZZZZ